VSWTLLDIRNKVRAVTGTPSTDQLSNAAINTYINNYYVYTMPFELKEQIQDNYLNFTTVVGQDVYSFPSGYFTDQPGAYADGFPLIFYQDKDIFYQDWPQQVAVDAVATGDGITNNFVGGVQNPPIIIGTFLIDDGVQILQDNITPGILTGNGSGTINYVTGAYNVTFTNAPAASATITAKYQGYVGNRPQGVLFFQNQFTFRPVPDQIYQIQMEGYIQPTLLVLDSDTPTQPEWGELLAYGASLEIFSSRGDMENHDRYYPIFKRYENVALGRTIQQFQSQQSVGRF
jgi:hypothetical protein